MPNQEAINKQVSLFTKFPLQSSAAGLTAVIMPVTVHCSCGLEVFCWMGSRSDVTCLNFVDRMLFGSCHAWPVFVTVNGSRTHATRHLSAPNYGSLPHHHTGCMLPRKTFGAGRLPPLPLRPAEHTQHRISLTATPSHRIPACLPSAARAAGHTGSTHHTRRAAPPFTCRRYGWTGEHPACRTRTHHLLTVGTLLPLPFGAAPHTPYLPDLQRLPIPPHMNLASTHLLTSPVPRYLPA